MSKRDFKESSKEFMDEFLTCLVCHEVYSDPCTLLCNHSFCRPCISKYLTTRDDAIRKNVIPCPSCRHSSEVPDPSKPLQSWSAQFKPSPLLLGLMDKIGSLMNAQKTCSVCKAEGKSTDASAWCSQCENCFCTDCLAMHNRLPSLQNHDIIDINSENITRTQRRRVFCKEHSQEPIRFLCNDCNKPLCQTCCIINHRQCKSVVTLQSLMEEITATITSRKEQLLKTELENEEDISSYKRQLLSLQESVEQTKQAVESTFEMALKQVLIKKQRLLAEVDRKAKAAKEDLEALVKSKEIDQQTLRQNSEFITYALDSQSEFDIYSAANITESMKQNEKQTSSLVSGLVFRPVVEQFSSAISTCHLGDVTVTYDRKLPDNLSLHQEDTISLKGCQNVQTPDPTDIVVIREEDRQVVVTTDMQNKRLFACVRKEDKWWKTSLELSGPPWGVTEWKPAQVAVSIPTEELISIVQFQSGLKVLYNIKTRRRYRAITALNSSELAAGAMHDNCIDILNTKGDILKSMHFTGTSFVSPWYMRVTSEGNIVMTECVTSSVFCLSPKGQKLFEVSHNPALSAPCGVTASSDGAILVLNRTTGTVVQLNNKGDVIRELKVPGNSERRFCSIYLGDCIRLYATEDGVGIREFVFADT